jgi:hypothetical protein
MKSVAKLMPGLWLSRVLFGLLTADALAQAGVACFGAGQLLEWLQVPELPAGTPPDRLLLVRLLGALALVHGGVSVILLVAPQRAGSVAVVPLLGRLLGVGTWLFLLGTDRLVLPRAGLWILLARDAVWVPPLAWFLIAWHRWKNE